MNEFRPLIEIEARQRRHDLLAAGARTHVVSRRALRRRRAPWRSL